VASRVAISTVSHRLAARTISPGAAVVALALPLLFLHRTWQPEVDVTLGSSSFDVVLSDFAVAAVVLAALWSGVRDGFAPLRAGRWIWLTGGFFAAWLVLSLFYGAARFDAYPFGTHAVSLLKWIEYMLLAPALPLLLRRRRDLELVLWSLALWSAAATFVGVLEFFGVDIAAKGAVGKRQASFLGSSDFSALSGAALLAGVVVRRGPLAWILIVAGAIGAIVGGSLSALLGLATALAVFAVVLVAHGDRRRVLTLAAVLGVVAAGSLAIRTADLSAFERFVGDETAQTSEPNKVQTYAHRTVLAYIGAKIWLGHPLLGVGWQGSKDAWAYMPYVDDAKRKFPDEPPLAFPAPNRSYGIQLLYLAALAELGIVGLAALVALFAATFLVAARSRDNPAGAIAALWTLFVVWCWTAQDFVAGIPLDALTWLTVGLAATGAAWRRANV
jgi:O-antigen ligase